MNDMRHFDTDVLIIGSGPTGATTALVLAQHGIRCQIVSRWNWLADTPRAHITNQRTMEVLRDLGLEPEVLREATPWDDMGEMVFATSLAGEELARLRVWGTGDQRRSDYLVGSPCGMVDIVQPLLEPILFKRAAATGATFTFNTEYMSHEQDEGGVIVALKERLTGREFTLRCKYLVGADGARSSIVERLGLPIEGHMARAGTAYVVFNADLTRYAAHRAGILHWMINSQAGFGEIGMGLLRAVKPWTQWIAGWGFDMSKGEPDLGDAAIRAKIAALIGDPEVEIDIVRPTIWYVNQAYATEYARGRVLCGGDAVHRHPPTSGLGLNTCVQDAYNLAWKIAYVLKGYAGTGLLETYSAERAPVGKQIVLRANQSRLDYGALRNCFRIEGEDDPLAAGIAQFKQTGSVGAAVRQRVRDALDTKSNEFNAQGVEMNQRYVSAAIVPDPALGEETWAKNATRYLQATTRPGAKIPHVWLIDKDGLHVSTLDVTGRGMFSVVTGLSGQAWVTAARALDLPYLRTVVIDSEDGYDRYCDWQRAREIEEAGALLVRPDGYIAWREPRAVDDPSEALRQLREALSGILGVRLA